MKIRYKTKSILIILSLAILIIGAYSTNKITKHLELKKIDEENKKTMEQIQKVGKNPSQSYLEVPFITQAPLQTESNWLLHEESCEEAALLQAYLYETDQKISKEEANKVILDMIEWQKSNFGEHKDLYAEEMRKFIKGYYGIDSQIFKDINIQQLKNLVSQGHPVIVPITGNILNNPYYPYPGYHMLTVIGYTEDKIITNDNGTKRGKDYSYDTETFNKAMQDAGADVLTLIINKNSSVPQP